MNDFKLDIFNEISNSVLNMDEENTSTICKKYVDEGIDPYKIIKYGLSSGMNRAGKLYEEGRYYIPELLLCSDAMYAGIDVVKPYLNKKKDVSYKVVIGVIKGDTHDIGKNLVKIMMETEGFEVIDLGRDVPLEAFVNAVKQYKASIIAMSTLMTTTMNGMKKVIDMLNEENLRDKVKVMIGGSPISQSFADKIGADAYTQDAPEAAQCAKRLVQKMEITE
ncbi:cobalamin B12-binding domain-containing protein [Clostridium tyrobutyricum]|uniref:cobalamin B12-binding domain-containing protein n=1 Tax=Clostridium tyrobutyricum TaxID=1519 RepID=UPI0003020931|nr:corrinoid protein [Clostridium tyrobutyricum]